MKNKQVYLVKIYEDYEFPILMGIYDDLGLAEERRYILLGKIDKIYQTVGIEKSITNKDFNDKYMS